MTQRQRTRIEHVVSAGGVVYRRSPEGVEVIICGRTEDGVWGLPKGTPSAGEAMEETARREVREETGLEVESEGKVDSIRYWFARAGVRYDKTVHHYLLCPVGGSIEQHDHEYDSVVWVPVEEACRRLSYASEAAIVRKAVQLLEGRHLRASKGDRP